MKSRFGGPEKFLVISVAFLSLLGFYFLLNPQAGKWLHDAVSGYFTEKARTSNDLLFLYLLALVSVVVANASVFIYIPYPLIIFIIAARPDIEPLILIISASIGAALGEFSAYILGFAGKKAIEDKEKYEKHVESLKKILERKPILVQFLVFLMALTPLPDDIILIPLGLVGYGFIRSFIPCFLGKLSLMIILVLGGKIFGEAIVSFLVGSNESAYPWLSDLIILYFVVIIVYVVLKIDFSKILKRFGISEDEIDKSNQ